MQVSTDKLSPSFWPAGQLFLVLFVFTRPMAFPEACLATIFYMAAMLLSGCHQTVGGRLRGAANLIGWFWPGLALGGGVVSLAFLLLKWTCS